MGDLRFILGFLAGWIVTTEEGKKAASALANKAMQTVQENLPKKEEKAD